MRGEWQTEILVSDVLNSLIGLPGWVSRGPAAAGDCPCGWCGAGNRSGVSRGGDGLVSEQANQETGSVTPAGESVKRYEAAEWDGGCAQEMGAAMKRRVRLIVHYGHRLDVT